MPRPVVASYCTTFLKREMRHIYRQVTALQQFDTFIMTKERQNADLYPFHDIEVLPRPRINFIARFHKKYLRRMEPVFYRGEYDQLSRVLDSRQADVLHVYFGHTGVHLLPFIRNWTKPAVVSFHGMDIMLRNEEPGYNDRLRELLQVLPMVLARSESLAARLIELGCDPAKIRINRTSIPMDGFPAQFRSAPVDGKWQLIQACRFIEKKGLNVTLSAFARFQKKYPAAELTLAGGGPLEKPLKELCHKLDISENVHFLGFLEPEQLARAYSESHLFVHPSQTTEAGDREGVPNAMLEAMAMSLPVVATLHGGIPEAVTSDHDGILVPERDAEALATAMLEIAEDRALYQKLSQNAAASVREKFEQQRSVAQLEGFYRELIS